MNILKHPAHDLLVSDCGRVFTLLMREKKLSVRPDGYLVTSTGGRGAPIRRVHHLVLETFVGFRPEGKETRHINGNPLDNRLCNLVWGDRFEQILDQKAHGTFSKPPLKLGKDNPGYRGVFDGEAMELAVLRYKSGDISLRSISTIYGVSRTHLRRCIASLGVRKGGLGHES